VVTYSSSCQFGGQEKKQVSLSSCGQTFFTFPLTHLDINCSSGSGQFWMWLGRAPVCTAHMMRKAGPPSSSKGFLRVKTCYWFNVGQKLTALSHEQNRLAFTVERASIFLPTCTFKLRSAAPSEKRLTHESTHEKITLMSFDSSARVRVTIPQT